VAVWTAAQTARFLVAARSDPLYPLLHLVAVRGLRRGEAVGLTWEAVDLDRATVTICRQVLSIGGRLVVGPPKSAASRRGLALDDDTVAALNRQAGTRPPGRTP
jgi:integrase